MTKHITLSQKWPERYFTGLSPALQKVREKELLKRRVTKNPTLGKSNLMVKTKKSQWTKQFHKVYPNLPFNKKAIAAKTGIPVKSLNTVYDRGFKAWQTGGSRPGTTPQQWAIARVYKFVLVTKKKAPLAWSKTRADPNANLR